MHHARFGGAILAEFVCAILSTRQCTSPADAIVYLIFSVIYWAATGENIYDALDWGNPSGAGKLSALILFVGLPFLWILMYCVFLGRRCHRVATSEDRAETV